MLDRALTVSRLQADLAASLAAAGAATPALDARLLITLATGLPHEALIAEPGRLLTAKQAETLELLARRRIAREPVSRIAGVREFYGREFRIVSATLDPRPETETLIDCAIRFAGDRKCEALQILDLGTGSGAILVSVLAELPVSRGVGTDLSQQALVTARENARRLGVAERASFVRTSWASGLSGQFDIILSNPPYVAAPLMAELEPEVRDYEPQLALDGGVDGLQAYRAIAGSVRPLLRPGGMIAVEIGAGQAEAVAEIFANQGIASAELRRDLAGRERVLQFA